MRTDLHGITIPSYDLDGRTEAQCKAEGVLFAESLFYMIPGDLAGKVVINFTGWGDDQMLWEIPEIRHFCQGALWGLHTNDGKLTAYHAQTLLSMMYDESEDQDMVFGKYMLVATVFEVAPTRSVEKVKEKTRSGKEKEKEKVSFSLDMGRVKQFIQDIEGEDFGDAEKRYVSMYSKVLNIHKMCGEDWPFVHYHELHGPLMVQTEEPIRSGMKVSELRNRKVGGVVLFKTEELCREVNHPGYEPVQIGEGELIALLAESYIRGFKLVEFWGDVDKVRIL